MSAIFGSLVFFQDQHDSKINEHNEHNTYETCDMGTLGCKGKLTQTYRNVYWCDECGKEDFTSAF